uniref:CCHC-type domain-containing protein n=1 Tax=Tetraodon nigroviridis TaxID=99883 RepID=H3C6W1_TETNG
MAAGVVSAPLIIASSSSHTHASRREIHTDTLVFIQSDTPGALIFYTLDGSRPEPDQSGSAARSRKYSKPVRLPAGRVAVRAVAVASDGRRSSTVTKMFVVQRREAGVEEKVPEVNQPVLLSPAGLWMGGDGSVLQNGPHPEVGEPASLPQKPVHGPPSGPVQGSDPLKQLRSTQTSRLVQDPEVLWDQQVLTARPPDPFSLFFPICGAKISHQTFPSRGTEQALLTSSAVQGHRVCGCCGSGNPVNVSSCLTCESCLQPQREPSSSGCWLASEDLAPLRRVRTSPQPGRSCVLCWRCGAGGHPASSCASCGVFLRAPTPPTAPPGEEPLHGEAEAMTGGSQQATPPPDCAWKMLRPPQTDPRRPWGSSTRRPLRGSRAGGRRSPRRRPPLTSVSPGKGYWRRQLDHVCAHLRSYTQNNAPFRALLGDPCMGQLLSAVVQDDQQQLTLTISFALA